MDFHLRLKRIGGKILLIPSISSFYVAPSDLCCFWRHSWNNGVWAVLPFAYSDGIPIALRHLVPFGFVVALLASVAASVLNPSSWAFGALITVYGAANIIASFFVARRERSVAKIFIMPGIFLALHAAYGFGSLWGIVRLIGRRGIWKMMKRLVATRAPAMGR